MSDRGIQLGDVVRDEWTGFIGLAIARAEYLTGCTQICVKPNGLTADGRMMDGEWLDEARVVVVAAAVVPPIADDRKAADREVAAGGPQANTPPAP